MYKIMSTFENKYKIVKKIGEGSFSEVVKCEDRTDKNYFAAKVLKKRFENSKDVLYCAEIIAMQKLNRHENVLHMHEYFYEKTMGKVIFIFDLMDMSLYDLIKSKRRAIAESKVRLYLYQVLKGLDYLHRHGLFHRDVKPENILVKLHGLKWGDTMTELVKLGDLGSIRGIFSKQPYTEYISTRWYRSPECLLTVGHYGPKMDIWAIGCVFYEILTFKPLFAGNNEIDQLSKIHHVLGTPSSRMLSKLKSRSRNLKGFNKQVGTGLGPLIGCFSEGSQAILKLMLQYDPDLRINSSRLLQHKYFEIIREEERFNKLMKLPREFGDSNYPTSRKQLCSSSLKSVNSGGSKRQQFSSRTSTNLKRKATLLDEPQLLIEREIQAQQLCSIMAKRLNHFCNKIKRSNNFRSTTSTLNALNEELNKIEKEYYSTSQITGESTIKKSRFKSMDIKRLRL